MPNLAALVTTSLHNLLTTPVDGLTGPDFSLNAIAQSMIALPIFPIASITSGNMAPEMLEHSLAMQYPAMALYCDKLSNSLKEKYRVFSGAAHIVIELRHSLDRIQLIQQELETYVAAACQILDTSRGDWGNGLFYAGGYEVSFGPVKRGGRNFLQIAKLSADIDISI